MKKADRLVISSTTAFFFSLLFFYYLSSNSRLTLFPIIFQILQFQMLLFRIRVCVWPNWSNVICFYYPRLSRVRSNFFFTSVRKQSVDLLPLIVVYLSYTRGNKVRVRSANINCFFPSTLLLFLLSLKQDNMLRKNSLQQMI